MDRSIGYIDAKARIVRAINRVTTFINASVEFEKDQTNSVKRSKISAMLRELNEIRRCVENDVQIMETSVGKGDAPLDGVDNKCSSSLLDSFDTLYYELIAFGDVYKLCLTPNNDQSSQIMNQTIGQNNLSCFQLPKRKFPTFSGVITEWQGFEDLFGSILSHAPELSAVEKFEYLKTSLEGEALSLITHLSLTSANYSSAWEILKARYGNKRDLARIHLDALLTPHVVKSNDSTSIKTLLNSILEHTAALDNLDYNTRTWSPILIHLFEKYLDYNLRSRWEQIVGDRHAPQLKEFVEFLRSHIRSAEIYGIRYTSQNNPSYQQTKFSGKQCQNFTSKTQNKVLTTSTNQPFDVKCVVCTKLHSIRKCQLFLNMSSNERFNTAKTHRLCVNCLGHGHSAVACPSKYKCQTCNKPHHTLLHFGSPSPTSQQTHMTTTGHNEASTSTVSLLVKGQPTKVILLSTTLLEVRSHDGSHHTLRAILDSGAQASFITERSACALMLRKHHSSINISTFASTSSTPVRGKSTIMITPCGKTTPSFCVETFIVPSITGPTPQLPISPGNWSHLKNLPLADPSFHTPGAIDLLLGADILPSLLLDGRQAGQYCEPLALETVFGWILMGPVDIRGQPAITSLCLSISDSEPLDSTLKKFWELEELPSIRHLSPDDTEAETFYTRTTTRLPSGRFMVKLPFRTPFPLLGDSKAIAMQRLKALEIRLQRNNDLRQQYSEFMRDYLTSGHMELIPPDELHTPYQYYIPHHCVLKPDSQTTKLRVVFNASATTSTGASLNESMYTGPKLQPDIQLVLLRARLWKYLFVADIKQMYRQILVDPMDRNYQRILWRFTDTAPVSEYRLCTITYGTSAAPFQALRTIRELATVDGASWPIAASVLLRDTFVDDILTGSNSEDDALECQTQLVTLCSQAQFELRKWASNSNRILRAVTDDARAMSPSVLIGHDEQPNLKILGLKWNPYDDTFSFTTQPSTKLPTKRSVLSDIARVFDPLGLLSPITFWTKHIMQQLWTSGIKWDDPIPTDIAVQWARYRSELQLIETISIPRRLTHDLVTSIQLHAFSDSSEKGYAAAVYLRVSTQSAVLCQLIMGKSKVSPLKKSTIPRLELCGAVLAAKLLRLVVTTYADHLEVNELHAWTDSMTTLSWIRSSPHRWATFVANRTSQIQELTPPSIWRHVPTLYNPVDCASRGLLPSDLVKHPLWWNGPPFLLEPSDKWPSPMIFPSNDDVPLHNSELKTKSILLVQTTCNVMDLLDRTSSLDKVLRTIAYCLRLTPSRRLLAVTHAVTAEEVSKSLSALIFAVQQVTFRIEISCLQKGLPCSKSLRSLDLFIDDTGLIRVGGRLNNANIPYDHKHPVLLPSTHRLTTLIIDHHHQRLKHPGASALQTHLQREFWIQSARRIIRSRLRLCMPCYRTKPKCIQPKMAVLPKYRVQQIKPFSIVGVDYAGPITVKKTRGRTSQTTSAYICLFVCMATKALHLELSSDLSTETFLMSFTRFAARRGPIREIHSDCGTNFVGASRLLNPLQQLTNSQAFQERVHNHLSTKQISWYFNPPSSPHFGGLWEAGVKSTKSLILRSIGTHTLTSEELCTLLAQVEATLNSRPLCALSSDPLDLEALTPSHFLTLEPPTALPDPSLRNVPLSKLQRWRLITDIHRHFWTRWTNEYLSSLQLRTKWTNSEKELTLGSLVLIKESTHPLYWRLGRIIRLHPGSDGVSRVATVKTATGTLTRPAVKLCPLPTC